MLIEGKLGLRYMSVLSSIDTSLFTTPYSAAIEANSFQPVRPIDYTKRETPNVAAEDPDTPKVDLNNYYSNVQSSDFNSDVLSDVVKAEQNFSDAVSSALANGYTPQDAVNIQMAKAAYAASMKVAEAENSTFELLI